MTRIMIGVLLCLHCTVMAQKAEVVVYGATPAGIFAALNAARQGHSVALVEEYKHIGGLMTGGLSFTDFISLEALGGSFDEYRRRALAYYENKYGKQSSQVQETYSGVNAEPHITEAIFTEMLAEQPSIRVYTQHRLQKAITAASAAGKISIRSAIFLNLLTNQQVTISGSVFIDATYEGDLAVAAGAEYRVGRESRQEYGERYAGRIFTRAGQVLAGGSGEADKKVQAYNYRIVMTDSAPNRRMVEKPAGYNRAEYAPIANVFNNGKVKEIFTISAEGILRVQPIANRKADINDIKNAPVRMSSLGRNYDYPDGNAAVRSRILAQHQAHILGMIYFLQHDESLPAAAREKALQWGLAKDEFTDNDNFPYRLYIREARRIMGERVFTEQDTYLQPGSIRSVLRPDAVATCDYALNCHGVAPPGPVYADLTEGDFGFRPQPFQIPYGVMLPKKIDNLLVPVAISSSHVGFCGIRLEPTWSALGQAAGLAAHLMLQQHIPSGKVKIAALQDLLIAGKAKLIYTSDIDVASPYFTAVQYFGTRGLFHNIYALEDVNILPLPVLKLQYQAACPYHDVQPGKALDEQLASKWILKLDPGTQGTAKKLYSSQNWTRGEFLNALYKTVHIR